MGICLASVNQEEMGFFDGRQNEGIFTDKFISFAQIESALLEYPSVLEAGVVSECIDNDNYILKIFLSIETPLKTEDEQEFKDKVREFITAKFNLPFKMNVQIKDKLPMTRSGKILRNVLRQWE